MVTRRETLKLLTGASALAIGGCCARGYPTSELGAARLGAVEVPDYLGPALQPKARSAQVSAIDSHAHFFNASDVPVRGFIAESIAHDQPPSTQELLKLLAPLAEQMALAAPRAATELAALDGFEATLRVEMAGEAVRGRWDEFRRAERENAARRVAEVTEHSDFARRYLEITSRAVRPRGTGVRAPSHVSENEVLAVVERNEAPRGRAERMRRRDANERDADVADGLLSFLFYLLSYRSLNLDAYRRAYTDDAADVEVEHAVGALVDFDYWLDCPPASSHDDQIALHGVLSRRSGYYMRPLVGYNPWTDIELEGAALQRVRRAIDSGVFVGVKIYPPMGFYPSGNEDHPIATRKRRPEAAALDGALEAFFAYCFDESVPVMAHTSHSNGRDAAHDELSSPAAWRRFLADHATRGGAVKLNLGHFGGAAHADWTQEFAALIREHPQHAIYADLGYWDALICDTASANDACPARDRLGRALNARIDARMTVADRTLFGTDWHMLSRVPDWPAYPGVLRDSIREIGGDAVVGKVLAANAEAFFDLRPPHQSY